MLKKGGDLKKTDKIQTNKIVKKKPTSIYYSIQIGAFKRRLKPKSSFFKGEKFYFEKQFDNLHKYFIGRFSSIEEAKGENKRISAKFRNSFIVVMSNDEVIPLNQFKEVNNK